MCQLCFDAVHEVFPSVPEAEVGDFLMGTTCFPFGEPHQVRDQLLEMRAQMKTSDYNECYAIADEELGEALAQYIEVHGEDE